MAAMILYPYVRYPKGIAVAFLISISGDRTQNGRSVLPLKPLVCTSIVHFAKSVPFFQRSSRASSLGCFLISNFRTSLFCIGQSYCLWGFSTFRPRRPSKSVGPTPPYSPSCWRSSRSTWIRLKASSRKFIPTFKHLEAE